MDWKDIGASVLKKILVGTVSILSLKAMKNILEGKDLIGRTPEQQRVKKGNYTVIDLDEDDYTVV